jgi:hypothetical protein
MPPINRIFTQRSRTTATSTSNTPQQSLQSPSSTTLNQPSTSVSVESTSFNSPFPSLTPPSSTQPESIESYPSLLPSNTPAFSEEPVSSVLASPSPTPLDDTQKQWVWPEKDPNKPQKVEKFPDGTKTTTYTDTKGNTITVDQWNESYEIDRGFGRDRVSINVDAKITTTTETATETIISTVYYLNGEEVWRNKETIYPKKPKPPAKPPILG